MTITLTFLTYNRKGVVSRCFRSMLPFLLEHDDIDWLILDNASTDGTAEWLLKLAKRYPRVRVILSAVNLGVGGGRQRLLDEATGDIVAFLDSDVEVMSPYWLDALTAPLSDPSVGIVGAGGFFVQPGWGWYAPAAQPGDVDVVAGFCQFFRRKTLDGYRFDPHYFPYWHEDSETCIWVKERGYRIVYPGDVGLRHVFAGSANATTEDGLRKQAYLASKWRDKGLVRFEQEQNTLVLA